MKMSKKLYLVLMEEDGIGCDYTIGCGKQWEYKEFSSNIVEAQEQALEWAIDWYGGRISYLWLVDEDDVYEADVIDYKAREEAKKQSKKLKDRENEERAELERLKKKYEN
jgi:hypothetical protein